MEHFATQYGYGLWSVLKENVVVVDNKNIEV